MKVALLQENLLAALQTVNAAVASRSTLPVLANVLLKTDKGMLKVASTNLELAITAWVGAKVDVEGGVTLPARTLMELVSSYPADRIDLELDSTSQTVTLRCGRAVSKIKGISELEYPLIPIADELASDKYQKFIISAESLAAAIAKTHVAAAKDESRPVLTGISFTFENGDCEAASADGFRLSVVKMSGIDTEVMGSVMINVPAKTMQQVAKAAKDSIKSGHGDVSIYVVPAQKYVIFSFENNLEVKGQLIDGKFPDYKQIIPVGEPLTTTTFDKDVLQRAITQALIFAKDSSNIVKLDIRQDDSTYGSVIISSRSSETGDFETDIDANVKGQSVTVAFNGGYMLDYLKTLDVPQVQLESNAPTNPGVFKPVGGDNSYIHIIMPMHINR